MNSIIEAQITLREEKEKEMKRCIDGGEVNGVHISGLHYYYLNYFLVDGKMPIFKEEDKLYFEWWNKIESQMKEGDTIRFTSRGGYIINKDSTRINSRRRGK